MRLNDTSNQIFYLFDFLFSDFNSCPRRRLEIDNELTGVRPGEIGDPELWDEAEAEKDNSENSGHGGGGPRQCHQLDPSKSGKKRGEFTIKTGIEATPPTSTRFIPGLASRHMVLGSLDKLRAKQGHDRHRDEVGGEQGKHYGERQCGKEELADAVKECDRKKHHCRRECRRQHWQRHFFPSFFCCDNWGFSPLEMPKNILQNHHRVVD